MEKTRYIFVIGGVMSGVGKGIATSSIGRILKNHGFNVSAIKIDPYINVDAGTMNPTEHGEVFVTDDGMECDQDVGNYERFLDISVFKDNYMTTGSVYKTVIEKERNLEYEGKCVEVVPHIPLEVIGRIKKAAKKSKADFLMIEIGGTVGEYQNLLFLEAARMMKLADKNRVMFVMVSYLPVPSAIGEMKTKPTQYAVRTLNSAGIQPDFIVARSKEPLDDVRKRKISVFCNVGEDEVISAPDISCIYEVPANFEKDNFGVKILKKFKMKPRKKDGSEWGSFMKKVEKSVKPVKIGIVGKYFNTGKFVLADSYISVIEAVKHAAWHAGRKPEIHWIDAEEFEREPAAVKTLKDYAGVVVPGGFGSRGIEGKIKTIQFCRENKIPFLGLCYGLQMAVVEFARNVCGLKNAHTTEINKNTPHPVIATMQEQFKRIEEHRDLGGTMRLGAYDCELDPRFKSYKLYKTRLISERHRHRYEMNNEYRKILEENGLAVAGINPDRNLIEIVEIPNHPFFVASQFHPEFKSRPLRPHPLFVGFVKAAIRSD